MTRPLLRAGFIGAGYISSWHLGALARLPDVRLVAICEPNAAAARALAATSGATVYTELGAMLDKAQLDAVHVLAPPPLHHAIATTCLAAGVHTLVEKPFALTAADAEAIVAAAAASGRTAAVNHNFLGLPGYVRLREAIAAGALGRIDSADIRWRLPLAALRSGPYGLWMLREPGNLLLELGPHLLAFVVDLFGPIERPALRLGKPISLPGGAVRHQSWQITGTAGSADLTLSLSLVEGAEDRSLTLRGTAGAARLDFGNDVLVASRANTADLVLNPISGEPW